MRQGREDKRPRRRRRISSLLRERTFRSMTKRNFRLFTWGNAVSVIGTWMQRVAQDWLVYTLTQSAVAVGISLAIQFAPTLVFGLWGGVLVDRLDRLRIIVGTQIISAILAAALGVLSLTGLVEVWMVYALAFGLGLVTVLDIPARQAFIAEMVDVDDYVNAQSLNSTVFNAGRLVGPAVAGLIIAGFGVSWAFMINAVSFVGVLIALLLMDRTQLHPVTAVPRAPGQVRGGLRYVAQRQQLTLVMAMVFIVALFGQNFRVVLPLFASESFSSGAEVYGYLMTAIGAGAVLGALVTASRRSVSGWAVLIACLAFGLANLAASAAPTIWIAYLAMTAIGFANISFNSLARTVLQVNSERSMHGRVLALHGMVFLGTTPIGGPLLGWISEWLGPRAGLALAGLTAVGVALVLLPAVRRVHKAELRRGVPVVEPAGQAVD